jgi:hypothetical protein
MAWKYWNKKQKKVFVILIIVLVIVFILAIPLLKGKGPIPGIGKIIALLLTAGIFGIVNLFENDYEENVSEGNCVKCNRPCQTVYFEKSNKIEYDCPTCGKNKI